MVNTLRPVLDVDLLKNMLRVLIREKLGIPESEDGEFPVDPEKWSTGERCVRCGLWLANEGALGQMDMDEDAAEIPVGYGTNLCWGDHAWMYLGGSEDEEITDTAQMLLDLLEDRS